MGFLKVHYVTFLCSKLTKFKVNTQSLFQNVFLSYPGAGDPVRSVYILDRAGCFLREIAYLCPWLVCLVIFINREKLLL